MESGEHTPSLERLIRISARLGIELLIDIRPEQTEAKLPRKRALEGTSLSLGGCSVVLATA